LLIVLTTFFLEMICTRFESISHNKGKSYPLPLETYRTLLSVIFIILENEMQLWGGH
jgi:hypothetical protein